MKRVWVWTFVLLLFYVLQTFAYQTDWAAAVAHLHKRVVRLEMVFENGDFGVCSGAVLHKDAGFVLSAAHCFRAKDGSKVSAVTVNDRHAEVARQNQLLDLAVVRTEQLNDADNMPLAAKPSVWPPPGWPKETRWPPAGYEIGILGYAWGNKRLHLQFGRVSLPLDDNGALVVDAMSVSGDSGGPTVNAAGELVGMTSFIRYNGPMMLAYMVPVDRVRDFVQGYLAKQP